MNDSHSLRTNLWVNAASAVVAVLLTVAFVALAAAMYGRAHGFTIGDLYDYYFPRYRGMSHEEPLPRMFYIASAACALIATQLAIACRRLFLRLRAR